MNQITVDGWSVPELVEACAGAGLGAVGLWRHKVAEVGVAEAARCVRSAGLVVSSLCRGGFFPADGHAARRRVDDDNRRAVDEAAGLGTDVLVLVCGPALGRDLPAARAAIREGVERLAPYAAEHGVQLAIEPLHPMMIDSRSAIVTLGEALDLVDALPGAPLGVVVDAYHVFWDPQLAASLRRAAGRVLGFHVSDWLAPTVDLLEGRGIMGDGVIDLPGLRAAVDAAGYDGWIEVEVISRALRERDPADVMRLTRDAFTRHVAP